jgi:hypothetical protein
MTNVDTRPVPVGEAVTMRIDWGAIVAGAIAAAAIAAVLHSFATAMGLSVSSAAPTWRDASAVLVLLSGLYLVLAALAAYGLGGYVAGRLRNRLTGAGPDQVEFHDGMHGLLVWALATLMTVLVAFATAQALTRLAAPSSGPATSVAGENIVAYDLDRLFRSERQPQGDVNALRAEAGRILLTASSHRGMASDDRAHLVRLVAARTGLAAPEAERRVDDVVARARENIARARRSAVVVAFSAGAAALLGAIAAWFAACAGGRIRDGAETPSALWDWSRGARA